MLLPQIKRQPRWLLMSYQARQHCDAAEDDASFSKAALSSSLEEMEGMCCEPSLAAACRGMQHGPHSISTA